MCGICGKISSNSNSNISEGLIRDMCRVMVHRGPDDEGVYLSGDSVRIGLGHRRLSIIDLSAAGHQPMSNEDKSLWLVVNGEIYNFVELREILIKKGHVFKSGSDAEVILHLYEERGIDCLSELRGPFAFALWDERKERLFIARDRLGKKPVNYIYKNRTLTFGSEIKAILQDPEVSVEVNRKAITDYLSYGYTPTPETMFKNIMKLPPAHFMIYEKGEIKIIKYWDLDFSKKIKMKEEEYAREIMSRLEEATRIRLISDAPLGVFLSGGIDSSTVVYMMSKINSRPVKTFSIGFEEKSYNELRYAKIVADYFGTEHHEYIVTPNAIELLPKLVWHYNEPYADSSALPSYYVANMTRQEVKVALNGDGGDETCGGYERFMAAEWAEKYRMLPEFLRENLIRKAIERLPEPKRHNNFMGKLKRFLLKASMPYGVRHYNWINIFRDNEKENLFTDDYKEELNNKVSYDYLEQFIEMCASDDTVDKIMYADINTNLLDDLIVKMDIATMANSLESRSPFLDHRFMEFAASMPSNMKVRGTRLKYILKKALKSILPREILSRGKMGFGIPVHDWFRNELKNYSQDILMSERCINRGYFKKEGVKNILDEHASGKVNHGGRIWSLLNLELWHRMFIDGKM